MKIIAYYLPQYHRIPENDIWWGEGFTEWTNTKKARPLYFGHYQPREPYKDYYYDLTESSARQWQADIAKRYGIYGFCYYHYWFKGKMLLERPFNEVLRSGEPQFPFCLCWANEPWTRTWDGMEHNILMPQEYGNEEDWEKHFFYLLEAFKDNRYIRIEDKPLFVIYRPERIPHCTEMLNYWNELAKKYGLKGIYFVKTLGGTISDISEFDAAVEFEPSYTIAHEAPSYIMRKVQGFSQTKIVADYDLVWGNILSRQLKPGLKTIPGAFIDWDNTARRGEQSFMFHGANPDKFSLYFDMQIKNAITKYKSEFLFINAWNEWAEGTYLEPDKRYGLRYLEGVRKALKNNGFIKDEN